MRYAIVSDIHSNLEALTATMDIVDSLSIDKIICLGDLVGYYANPNECLQIIRDRKIHCIAGNHDRVAIESKEPMRFGEAAKRAIFWTREHLITENIRFLEKLPFYDVIDSSFIIVHGSLYPKPNEDLYLVSKTEVVKNFEELKKNYPRIHLCFFGHSHLSVVYAYKDGMLNMIDGTKVRLNPDFYYLINPGSVGQSRERDPRGAFLIFDSKEKILHFHRVEYNREASHQKADQAGLIYREGFLRKSANWIVDWIEAGRQVIANGWSKR